MENIQVGNANLLLLKFDIPTSKKSNVLLRRKVFYIITKVQHKMISFHQENTVEFHGQKTNDMAKSL